MTLLNEADKVYLGSLDADAVYLGATKVWPTAPPDLSDIPGMTLWIEADDVPQTVDGFIASGEVPARVGPTGLVTANFRIVMNGIGGHKAFDYNPYAYNSQWIDVHNLTAGPDVTAFAVVDAGAQPTEHADLMDFNHAVGGGWVIQQNSYGPGTFFAWRVSNAFTLCGDLPYPGVPHIAEVTKSGGHVTLQIGDQSVSADGPAGLDMTTGQLRIGNYVNTGDRPFLGKIAMVAVWPRALTPAEHQQVEAYLRGKWGLP